MLTILKTTLAGRFTHFHHLPSGSKMELLTHRPRKAVEGVYRRLKEPRKEQTRQLRRKLESLDKILGKILPSRNVRSPGRMKWNLREMTMVYSRCMRTKKVSPSPGRFDHYKALTADHIAALDAGMPVVAIPTLREYYIDLDKVLDISSDGPSKSFAFRRLQYLEGKWNLYTLLNEHQEMADSKVSGWVEYPH